MVRPTTGIGWSPLETSDVTREITEEYWQRIHQRGEATMA
jgi:hypothetical protein